jgi:hypothetical protein
MIGRRADSHVTQKVVTLPLLRNIVNFDLDAPQSGCLRSASNGPPSVWLANIRSASIRPASITRPASIKSADIRPMSIRSVAVSSACQLTNLKFDHIGPMHQHLSPAFVRLFTDAGLALWLVSDSDFTSDAEDGPSKEMFQRYPVLLKTLRKLAVAVSKTSPSLGGQEVCPMFASACNFKRLMQRRGLILGRLRWYFHSRARCICPVQQDARYALYLLLPVSLTERCNAGF